MKRFLLASTFLLVVSGGGSFAATNPDPFCSKNPSECVGGTRKPSPPVPVEIPAPSGGGTVVMPAPQVHVEVPQTPDTLTWIIGLIGGIFTLIYGGKTLSEVARTRAKPDFGALINDPAFHQFVDKKMLEALDKGLPPELTSRIPGYGLFGSMIERLAHDAVAKKLAADQQAGPGNEALREILNRLDKLIPKAQGTA